jgi:hypothetical protein
MKRSLWFLFVCAAIGGLMPALAWASTFESAEISTLNLTSNNGAGPGGLVMLQNTGLQIDDVSDSAYYPSSASQAITGWAGIVKAIQDGSVSGSTQGIASENFNTGANYPADQGFYRIGWNNNSVTNTAILRETWEGDANLDGQVNGFDYANWLAEYTSHTPAPAAWNNGDFNGDGLVNGFDYGNWLAAYTANSGAGLPNLGVTSPFAKTGGVSPVPEPSTLALCLAGAIGLIGCGVRKLRKNSTTSMCHFSKGSNFMKSLFVVAAIVSLALAGTARADVMDYYLVVDSVSNAAGTSAISGVTGLGTTSVVLPKGTTAAVINMAIVATINTGSTSMPISSDGIGTAVLDVTGTNSNAKMGTGHLATSVNDGISINAYNSSYGSPVQAFFLNNATTVSTTWATNFKGAGYQSGVAGGGSEGGNSMIIGHPQGPYASSDETSGFYPIFSNPSVPGTARLGTWNGSGYGNTKVASSALQPNYLLVGASGVNATSASFVLGQLTYTFNGALASGGGSVSIVATPANGTNLGSPTSNFEVGGVSSSAYYNTVTSGAVGGTIVGLPTQISIAGGGGTPANATLAVTSVNSSVCPPTGVMQGSSTTITGTITNDSSGGENLASYNITGAAALGTVTPASGTGLALTSPAGSTGANITYTATASGPFGVDNVLLSSTGQGATVAAVGSTNVPAPVMVVGKATTGAADGSTYGSSLTSVTTANYAGLETSLSGVATSGIGSTYALILAGTGTSTQVVEKWRNRTAAETPVGGTIHPPLVSDVANISGIASGTGNAYALQMSYDAGQIGGTATIENLASAGLINLQTYNGAWVNAGTVGDQGASKITNYQGSWNNFIAGPGAGKSLASLLGSWGVDTANNDVWSVVDYSGKDFAVTPEPGTLALLAAGAVALGLAYRRRKAAKA